jgi:hypothetical protein
MVAMLAAACFGAASAFASSTSSARWGLVYARVVRQGNDRVLMLRINEPSPVARIRITLLGRQKHTIRKVTRNIGTNRRRVVPKLKLPHTVQSVRIRVVRLID